MFASVLELIPLRLATNAGLNARTLLAEMHTRNTKVVAASVTGARRTTAPDVDWTVSTSVASVAGGGVSVMDSVARSDVHSAAAASAAAGAGENAVAGGVAGVAEGQSESGAALSPYAAFGLDFDRGEVVDVVQREDYCLLDTLRSKVQGTRMLVCAWCRAVADGIAAMVLFVALHTAVDTVCLLLRIDAIVRATDLRTIAQTQQRRLQQTMEGGVIDTRPVRYTALLLSCFAARMSFDRLPCVQKATYRRPRAKLSSQQGWTTEEKEKHDRKERAFYSKVRSVRCLRVCVPKTYDAARKRKTRTDGTKPWTRCSPCC